jgi:hypothetical protein
MFSAVSVESGYFGESLQLTGLKNIMIGQRDSVTAA